MLANDILVNCIHVEFVILDLLCNMFYGFCYFPFRRIAQCQHHTGVWVLGCFLFQVMEGVLHLLWQSLNVTHHTAACAMLLTEFFLQMLEQQHHSGRDFSLRSLTVLRGESI